MKYLILTLLLFAACGFKKRLVPPPPPKVTKILTKKSPMLFLKPVGLIHFGEYQMEITFANLLPERSYSLIKKDGEGADSVIALPVPLPAKFVDGQVKMGERYTYSLNVMNFAKGEESIKSHAEATVPLDARFEGRHILGSAILTILKAKQYSRIFLAPNTSVVIGDQDFKITTNELHIEGAQSLRW